MNQMFYICKDLIELAEFAILHILSLDDSKHESEYARAFRKTIRNEDSPKDDVLFNM